jgi:hypothetical protein
MRKILLGSTLALGLALGALGGATAKIAEVDLSCTNPAGQLPGGQQPTCEGNAHAQESEAQNPAGHAPPGQN